MARRIDLLDEGLYQSYLRDPALFANGLRTLPRAATVVVDEIQRLPRAPQRGASFHRRPRSAVRAPGVDRPQAEAGQHQPAGRERGSPADVSAPAAGTGPRDARTGRVPGISAVLLLHLSLGNDREGVRQPKAGRRIGPSHQAVDTTGAAAYFCRQVGRVRGASSTRHVVGHRKNFFSRRRQVSR
jgi:hypothetical protein